MNPEPVLPEYDLVAIGAGAGGLVSSRQVRLLFVLIGILLVKDLLSDILRISVCAQ